MCQQRADGAVYEIRGRVPDGFYWFVSRPGHPGDQSDIFATEAECEADVLREYPGARREQVRYW